MRRREFIAGLGGAGAAWPLAARAQQPKVPVVGFLITAENSRSRELQVAARLGLREAGFIEGRNVVIQDKGAEGVYERLSGLAAELVAAKVDVIIAQAPPAARAAKAATSTIPIVFGVGVDPVAEGLVASLARPGGNMTGVALLGAELMAKRFSLLAELLPDARRFALLVNQNNENSWIGGIEDAAKARGGQLQILKAATLGEIDVAFLEMVRGRAEALLIGEDNYLNQQPQITELALRHLLPTIGLSRNFTEIGGMASYGTSFTDAYRLIGNLAGRILKGAKPADLPVQLPVKFELVLNLKTAKTLGLTFPPLLLAQADEVIE
jgi:putative tryptophan/tyrosine transport system substrate-binding protein